MRKGMKIVAVLFWLLVWQIAALIWKDSIVFVGPVDMMGALIDQVGSSSFWISIARSFLCIMGGFLAAFAASALLAVLAAVFPLLQVLLEPVVTLQKSVPMVPGICLWQSYFLWRFRFYTQISGKGLHTRTRLCFRWQRSSGCLFAAGFCIFTVRRSGRFFWAVGKLRSG